MRSLKVLAVVFVALAALMLGVTAGTTGSRAEHPCAWPGVFGDANDDGTVTSADALITLRAAVGLYVQSACGPHDVDCDHDGDSVDALKILRYAAGMAYSQVDPCPDIGTTETGGQ